jgi:hypothetical protein
VNTRPTYRTALLLAALGAAACSGDPAAPGTETPVGALSLQYSGPATGTLATRGTPQIGTGGAARGDWAYAIREDTANNPRLLVAGMKLRADRHDHLTLISDHAATGTYTVDGDCEEGSCTMVALFVGQSATNAATFEHSCMLETGTVEITSVTGRVRGTFSGSGFCITPAGIVGPGFMVTGGTFDVPLLN